MKTIVGHTWAAIQRAQQGGRLSDPVAIKPKAQATDEDRDLLAKHGEIGLRNLGLFGVLDRLNLPTA